MRTKRKPSTKGLLKTSIAIIKTSRWEPRSYLIYAVGALTIKVMLYVLSQTVFLAGTPTYTRLSLDSDAIILFIAMISTFRARDAGISGIFGFFGSLMSFYGVFVLLLVAVQKHLVGMTFASIVPLITQFSFMVWIAKRPSESPL